MRAQSLVATKVVSTTWRAYPKSVSRPANPRVSASAIPPKASMPVRGLGASQSVGAASAGSAGALSRAGGAAAGFGRRRGFDGGYRRFLHRHGHLMRHGVPGVRIAGGFGLGMMMGMRIGRSLGRGFRFGHRHVVPRMLRPCGLDERKLGYHETGDGGPYPHAASSAGGVTVTI